MLQEQGQGWTRTSRDVGALPPIVKLTKPCKIFDVSGVNISRVRSFPGLSMILFRCLPPPLFRAVVCWQAVESDDRNLWLPPSSSLPPSQNLTRMSWSWLSWWWRFWWFWWQRYEEVPGWWRDGHGAAKIFSTMGRWECRNDFADDNDNDNDNVEMIGQK